MNRNTASKLVGQGPSADQHEIDKASHNATQGTEQGHCGSADVQNVTLKEACDVRADKTLFNGIGSQFTEKKN